MKSVYESAVDTMSEQNDPSDFYEEDEPVEKIKAAWKRGKKGRTKRPLDQEELEALEMTEEELLAMFAQGEDVQLLRKKPRTH